MGRNFKDYLKEKQEDGTLTSDDMEHIYAKRDQYLLIHDQYQKMLAAILQEGMEAKGLGFRELSRMTGKSSRTLHQILTGKSNPTVLTLMEVLSAVGKRVVIQDV